MLKRMFRQTVYAEAIFLGLNQGKNNKEDTMSFNITKPNARGDHVRPRMVQATVVEPRIPRL